MFWLRNKKNIFQLGAHIYFIQEVESVCSKWQTCQLEEEEIERATPEEQENLVLTLPMPVTTFVVWSSRLLMFLGSL